MKGCFILMKDVRIVIVDDSVFSVAFIRDILESNEYEVVGDAGSLEQVKEVVKEKKPTLITMDLTLPGADGFECMRAIHEIDKSIKFIVVSSMMDDELLKKAKKYKASGFVQKPVDADELITTIKRVTDSEDLYRFLKDKYFAVFKEGLMDTLNSMTKTLLTYKDSYPSSMECRSAGVTAIVGIIGAFAGRMLIDMSKETADNLAAAILKRSPKSNDEFMAVLGEFTNIIAGNSCSVLNRKNKALMLRVAPPSILSGDEYLISSPDFNAMNADADTKFGSLLLNVGFKEGEESWM
jgi:DNA-binding NarL/FixJ family response regulator